LVTLHDNRFSLGALTVAVGKIVTWANDGPNLHTISALDGTFDSGALRPGERWAHSFNNAGEFRYICSQHALSGMSETISVR